MLIDPAHHEKHNPDMFVRITPYCDTVLVLEHSWEILKILLKTFKILIYIYIYHLELTFIFKIYIYI